MFALHRKHAYGPPRSVTGIGLTLYADDFRTSQETYIGHHGLLRGKFSLNKTYLITLYVTTGYKLQLCSCNMAKDKGSELEFRQDQENFLFTSSRPDLGPTRPSFQRVPGDLSPGDKSDGV
jgi:hypothetical protein